jgi:hypothetical protein
MAFQTSTTTLDPASSTSSASSSTSTSNSGSGSSSGGGGGGPPPGNTFLFGAIVVFVALFVAFLGCGLSARRGWGARSRRHAARLLGARDGGEREKEQEKPRMWEAYIGPGGAEIIRMSAEREKERWTGMAVGAPIFFCAV